MGVALYLNNLKILLLKVALCQVWINWLCSSGEKDFLDFVNVCQRMFLMIKAKLSYSPINQYYIVFPIYIAYFQISFKFGPMINIIQIINNVMKLIILT